jgi:hypothetical protein
MGGVSSSSMVFFSIGIQCKGWAIIPCGIHIARKDYHIDSLVLTIHGLWCRA